MKEIDYAPSDSPNIDEQRDALSKGLGRAFQWARAKRLDSDILLEACLHDKRHDRQVEAMRADWLWVAMRELGVINRFRGAILDALQKFDDQENAEQLCGFARCFSKAGDAAFRSRLYEIVEQTPFVQIPWLGEDEILALDGDSGFLFAAKVRGRELADREWHSDDDSFVWTASERIGENRVRELMRSASDEAIRRFHKLYRQAIQARADREPALTHRERMARITVAEILKLAETPRQVWLMGAWGKEAGEDDLRGVVQVLWGAREPDVTANLLRVFSARPLPDFDSRMIDLCRHDNDMVRRCAFTALANISNLAVRDFALGELYERPNDRHVVALFTKNYRPRDEYLLFEATELPDGQCGAHWFLMNLIELLEENDGADRSRIAPLVYFMTPCENCRFKAFQLLHSQKSAPDWMVEECRDDSNEERYELAHSTDDRLSPRGGRQ